MQCLKLLFTTFYLCIQVPFAFAFLNVTNNIISFIILANMSMCISNNNKPLDKCILRVLKLCSHDT